MMPNSAGLNGTRYTCKAETASGEIYSKTVDILVKGIPQYCHCSKVKVDNGEYL